jgi:hypothetical protein
MNTLYRNPLDDVRYDLLMLPLAQPRRSRDATPGTVPDIPERHKLLQQIGDQPVRPGLCALIPRRLARI